MPRARGTGRVRIAILVAACTLALPVRGLGQEVGLERHVIYLKNAKAAELAETLDALIAGEPGSPRPVRIVADVRSNALVIDSSPEDFEALRDVIGQLDTRRPQVLLESVVLELRSDADRALEAEPLVAAMRAAAPLTGTILGSSVELRSWRPGGPIELPPLEAAALPPPAALRRSQEGAAVADRDAAHHARPRGPRASRAPDRTRPRGASRADRLRWLS